MKKYLLTVLIIIFITVLITGCGGGNAVSSGSIPSQTNEAPSQETPEIETPEEGAGTFTVTFEIPGNVNDGIESSELEASIIPWQRKTLSVTITGPEPSNPLVETQTINYGGSYTFTIDNVPVGPDIATLEVFDEENNLLAQRKQGFFMQQGANVSGGSLSLGVAVNSDGTYSPENIEIPVNTRLFFENQDSTQDRTITLSSSSISIGPIAKAQEAIPPYTPASYSALSYYFSTAGIYTYDGALGQILVYGIPSITSITPDSDTEENLSTVTFTISGDNFGPDINSVEGRVKFYDFNLVDAYTAEITSWGENEISGSVEMPGDKYYVQVTSRGSNSMDEIYFEKGNGPFPSWEYVGSRGFSNGRANYTSLYVYNGTPYIAYGDEGSSNYATVMKYNGTDWEYVGNPGFSNGIVEYTSLYVYNGTPYVAYRDSGNSSKATVMMFNGSNWIPVGNRGFSGGRADCTSLYVYDGTPYVAYRDLENSGYVTVMRYNGIEWEYVGNSGFSNSSADFTSLYIYNGTPYVAYRDLGNSAKATVMKYNGSSWEYVGNRGFSGGDSPYTSLYVYNGIPYVAYRDSGNSNYATVMEYNGTDWEYVGNPGFSGGRADYTSLYIYDGTPYVAYRDYRNNIYTTVMRYNGSSWEYVGTPGFSDGVAYYTSLYVYNGIPYVAYRDAGNSDSATVVKYNIP